MYITMPEDHQVGQANYWFMVNAVNLDDSRKELIGDTARHMARFNGIGW